MKFSLQEHERVKEIIHKPWISLWRPLLLGGIMMVLPCFFLFSFINWGRIGIGIFSLIEIIGVIVVIRAFILWDANRIVVTTQREIRLRKAALWHETTLETAPHHEEPAHSTNGIA